MSLLPSATEIVFALGLGDELVGRTHECDFPPEVALVPVVTAAVGATPGESPRGVDERLRDRLHSGGSGRHLDEAALAAARPDLILTQGRCEACAFSQREVAVAARRLEGEVTVVSLEPTSIEGILNTISTVGAMTEAEDEAVGLVELLRERLATIENRVLERRLEGVAPRRVVCLEWLDPPFAAGHWVPEQVRRAGGWDLLGREGERSSETTWDAVREVDPEQLFLMPCGLDAPATAREWARAPRPAWFGALGAALHGELFALDAGAYFSRPGPRVIEGIALLAELIDPRGFEDEALGEAWLPLSG